MFSRWRRGVCVIGVRRRFYNRPCCNRALQHGFISSPVFPAPAKGAKKTARKVAGEVSRNLTTDTGQRPKKTATAGDEKERAKGKDQDDGKDRGGKGKAPPSKDDTFREFRRVCSNIADVDAYTDKTAIIRKMFERGAQGVGKYLQVSRYTLYCHNPYRTEVAATLL